eukprot:10629179-Alexandrium_andersonii.AAC.1
MVWNVLELGLHVPAQALEDAICPLGLLDVGHLAPTTQRALPEPVVAPAGPRRRIRVVALLAAVSPAVIPRSRFC